MIRGRIHTIAVVQKALKHGGQTVGNVQQFARHSVTDPDGERCDVPFVSGNSIKHLIRESGADFAREALGLGEGSMSRAETYLLYAGGALDKSGQSVRLDKARRAEELMPILGLCGYAAGNVMAEAQLRVDDWELACWENSQRISTVLGAYAEEHIDLLESYSEEWIETAQRTGHDPTRRAKGLRLLNETEREEQVKRLTVGGKATKDAYRPMPYEYETLIPGAVLVGGFSFSHGVRPLEIAAFRSALIWASEGQAEDGGMLLPVGGGGSTARGYVSLHLFGEIAEGIQPLRFVATDELCPPRDIGDAWDDDVQAYISHLVDHKDELVSALGELVA